MSSTVLCMPIVQCGKATQLLLPKGTQPQFSAHVCSDQTAGWIKMSLGREVVLGPGHIVLDGDPAPPPKGAQFRSMSISMWRSGVPESLWAGLAHPPEQWQAVKSL